MKFIIILCIMFSVSLKEVKTIEVLEFEDQLNHLKENVTKYRIELFSYKKVFVEKFDQIMYDLKNDACTKIRESLKQSLRIFKWSVIKSDAKKRENYKHCSLLREKEVKDARKTARRDISKCLYKFGQRLEQAEYEMELVILEGKSLIDRIDELGVKGSCEIWKKKNFYNPKEGIRKVLQKLKYYKGKVKQHKKSGDKSMLSIVKESEKCLDETEKDRLGNLAYSLFISQSNFIKCINQI